jgi:hypothetical protein
LNDFDSRPLSVVFFVETGTIFLGATDFGATDFGATDFGATDFGASFLGRPRFFLGGS